MVRHWRRQWDQPPNIEVSAVCPAVIDTGASILVDGGLTAII